MSDNIQLSTEEVEVLNDLRVQAMMFGAAIDWETLGLNFSKPEKIPVWQQKYNEKRAEADFDENMDIDR